MVRIMLGKGNEFIFLTNILHYSQNMCMYLICAKSLDFSAAKKCIADLRSEKASALCLATHLGLFLLQSFR